MGVVDVIMPETEKLNIGGREYAIGKLTLRQFLLLAKFFTKSFLGNKARVEDYKKKTAAGDTSNLEDMILFIEMLEPAEVSALFGIILSEQDTAFIDDNLTLDKSILILKRLLEVNETQIVKKNILAIVEMLAKTV